MPPDNRDDDLRRQIRELAARVEALVSEAREHERKAAELRAEADRLMPGAGGLGRPVTARRSQKPLRSGEHSVKVDPMVSVHRLAISRGRAAQGDDAAFLEHIGAHKPKGYSLRSLADALDVSAATLHAHRKPKGEPNSRPCPLARAEQVKRLTGWPADAAHWPAGLS